MGLDELALGRWLEALLLDIAACRLKDPIVVQYASEAKRPLDVVIAVNEPLPKSLCVGCVHVDVFIDPAKAGPLADDHEIQIAARRTSSTHCGAGQHHRLRAHSERTLEDCRGSLPLGGRLQRRRPTAV